MQNIREIEFIRHPSEIALLRAVKTMMKLSLFVLGNLSDIGQAAL
jgi:hypothetical protein